MFSIINICYWVFISCPFSTFYSSLSTLFSLSFSFSLSFATSVSTAQPPLISSCDLSLSHWQLLPVLINFAGLFACWLWCRAFVPKIYPTKLSLYSVHFLSPFVVSPFALSKGLLSLAFSLSPSSLSLSPFLDFPTLTLHYHQNHSKCALHLKILSHNHNRKPTLSGPR